MADRDAISKGFLHRAGWSAARRQSLAGDASNRRYERLVDRQTGRTAVLMDADPEKGENVRPFVQIATYLRSIGLSAPEIYAADTAAGFLLLEDLGDDLFARVVLKAPALEPQLYAAATDVLVVLHRQPGPQIDAYSPGRMTDLAALAFSKYRKGILGDADDQAGARFEALFENLLRRVVQDAAVLVQRDYHAENLLWLPDREGVARVGLLDFQDAMTGHPAYDLVSLLQDARRDVPAEIESAMTERYIRATGRDEDAFRAAYAILGAQRNLRILGVFARLATDYGKPHYVDLIPRVWAHLLRDLEHPLLAEIAPLLLDTLPVPTDPNLKALKPS